MKTHNVEQGTIEWLDLRKSHYTASEAPAMMGASKYIKRDELLREKKTGERKPISDFQQRIFDKGHKAEEDARAIVERLVGEELYNTTITKEIDSLPLLASMDGLTLDGSICFEHKLWNESLAQSIEFAQIEPHYLWQIAQQLIVSGSDRCIFVCSDGTEEKMKYFWIDYAYLNGALNSDWEKQLIDGWNQFKADLEAYELPLEIEADEATDALLQQYKEAIDEEKAAKEKANQIAEQLKQIAKQSGAKKINAEHGFISLCERKGSVDYKKIPELKGIDLDKYRKESTQFYTIKTA